MTCSPDAGQLKQEPANRFALIALTQGRACCIESQLPVCKQAQERERVQVCSRILISACGSAAKWAHLHRTIRSNLQIVLVDSLRPLSQEPN